MKTMRAKKKKRLAEAKQKSKFDQLASEVMAQHIKKMALEEVQFNRGL